MLSKTLRRAEAGFILGFGLFHFAIPFILPPNFAAAATPSAGLFSVLHIADLVIPGILVLAFSSIIFFLTKNRYPAILLSFLYAGGIAFHILFLAGILPSTIVVPNSVFLVFGIFLDAASILAIYNYYCRVHHLR